MGATHATHVQVRRPEYDRFTCARVEAAHVGHIVAREAHPTIMDTTGKTQAQTDLVADTTVDETANNGGPVTTQTSLTVVIPAWVEAHPYVTDALPLATQESESRTSLRLRADREAAAMLQSPAATLAFCDMLTPFIESMRDEKHRAACAVVEQIRAHATAWQSATDMAAEEHKLDVQANLFLLARVGPKSVRNNQHATDILRSLMLAANRSGAQAVTRPTYAPVTANYTAFLKRQADRKAQTQQTALPVPTESEARAVNAAVDTK